MNRFRRNSIFILIGRFLRRLNCSGLSSLKRTRVLPSSSRANPKAPCVRSWGDAPLRHTKIILLAWLFLTLLFGVYHGPTSRGQSDPLSLSRGKLLDGLRDVQNSDSLGISPEDSAKLVKDLNVALVLQEQANASGSSSLAVLSINQSTSVSTRAISLGNSAQLGSLFRPVEGYGLAIVAGALTALLGVESHRLNGLFGRRRVSQRRREAE